MLCVAGDDPLQHDAPYAGDLILPGHRLVLCGQAEARACPKA